MGIINNFLSVQQEISKHITWFWNWAKVKSKTFHMQQNSKFADWTDDKEATKVRVRNKQFDHCFIQIKLVVFLS